MGITDGIVKLFQISQIDAIMNGTEVITAESIAEIADTQMPLTNKMITALRDKDFETLSQYDDIFCLDVNALIDNSVEKLEQRNDLRQLKKSLDYKKVHDQEQIQRELAILALELGSKDEQEAMKIAKKIINENGTKKPIQELKKLTAIKMFSIESKKEETTLAPKKSKKKSKTIDVSNETNYQDYKNNNKIKDPLEEFIL